MAKTINLLFRKRDKGISIEEVFTNLRSSINSNSNFNMLHQEVPCKGTTFRSIIKNILFTHKLKGAIHITGDVHYVALNPFKTTILTIHDVGSALKGNRLHVFLKKIIWFWLPGIFANKITVISSNTKKEVLNLMPWIENKLVVIHNPVNSILEPVSKAFNSQNPKILHIGTKENKNLENTILGLRNINCTLQIVGILSEKQLNLIQESQISWENFNNLQYFEIKNLYENCDIVSFISKYEGFGMPIIEAQKVGRVVITSNRASIPEVAGKGAHFVDPNDVKNIEKGFKLIIEDEEFRSNLIKEGSTNVMRFDIKNIGKEYIALYQQY